jgi:hypothetical protein
MDPAQQWHMINSTPPVPTLYYLVVELNAKRSTIFDSRFNKSFQVSGEGKRQLLIAYLQEQAIPATNIISIHEVLLPSNRSQIVCYYHLANTNPANILPTKYDTPALPNLHTS